MPVNLKPVLWETFKWVVVPSGLALLGFYVLGSNLGAPATAKNTSPAKMTAGTEDGPGKKFGEPEVEVSVRRGARVTSSEERRQRPRRRKRSRPKTTTEPTTSPVAAPPTVQSEPPMDPPSSGDGG
ncbi:MAG TPA: hypothetical protein VEX38_09440 [Fimbriimonadaceae bacterium]|nr:hypothetical protein [Fimbriimonadaceae bacterium]